MVAGFEAMARSDWKGAAEHFLAAAEDRERLPWREDGESAWMLAAAWLNHGDVLQRLADPALLPDALQSFDRSIEAMGCVDLARNPSFPDRLILSWINRGTACCDAGDFEASLAGFAHAEMELSQWGDQATLPRFYLSAILRVNRARAMMLSRRSLDAWQEVRSGIARLRSISVTPETAAANIQARSIQCRALADLLDQPGLADQVGDWIAEATDSAEQALALVRATGFRGACVADLVRYGAIIYRACQPHFLGEFVTEWLGRNGPVADDTALKAEMRGMLWLSIADAERKVLAAPHETEFVEKQTRIVASLQEGLRALA